MEFRIEEVSGIGEYREEKTEGVKRYFARNAEGAGAENDRAEKTAATRGGAAEKAFLVLNFGGGGLKTLEVRCDRNLSKLLLEKYESVMESRYFGKGGIEIVPTQLSKDEVYDLVRLSYNLTIS